MASSLRTSLGKLAETHDEPRFRSVLRTVCAIGFGIAVVTEALAYVSPKFPKDTIGAVIMGGSFALCALAAHYRLSRRALGLLSIALFAILGWYLARTVFASGAIASPHRDAFYLVLVGAHAVLTFSALEFAGVTLMMGGSFVVTALGQRELAIADFDVTVFYILGVYLVATFGILGRTRLQRSELTAKRELETLNESLAREVESQVARIQRAQLLGRFLPREISQRILDGKGGPALAHARREVTVLCAVPVGFLESLSTLEAEQVAERVNRFVSAMARLAHEHGGVIERFVGPRITVLFGAIDELPPAHSAARAAEMADAMQRESNRLLRQWEGEGLAALRLRMAIGLASGTAVVGTFGSERRVEYSALGDAMVRAHQLAGVAIPGEVRFDETCARRLEGVRELRPGAPVEFEPGKPAPTYVLTAAAEDSAAPAEPALAASAVFSQNAVMRTTQPEPNAQAKSFAALAPGSLFDGRYRIEQAIGRGGMAVVYRAQHESLQQQRAIKIISAELLESAHAAEQFRREAEATSRIDHPNVVRLHDFGRSIEGHYYLALDLVRGGSLAQVLQTETRLRERRAVAIAIDILSALQAAHELRLVHRDVKPANVLLEDNGRVRVTDFGLAQPLGASVDPTHPLIVGTPLYMSPEQCQGKALDGRSDLYSFGVTFYEMLCGTHPYRIHSDTEVLRAVVYQEPSPLAEHVDVSPSLWPPIARCLRKESAQRPSSALEVRQELERWYGQAAV